MVWEGYLEGVLHPVHLSSATFQGQQVAAVQSLPVTLPTPARPTLPSFACACSPQVYGLPVPDWAANAQRVVEVGPPRLFFFLPPLLRLPLPPPCASCLPMGGPVDPAPARGQPPAANPQRQVHSPCSISVSFYLQVAAKVPVEPFTPKENVKIETGAGGGAGWLA